MNMTILQTMVSEVPHVLGRFTGMALCVYVAFGAPTKGSNVVPLWAVYLSSMPKQKAGHTQKRTRFEPLGFVLELSFSFRGYWSLRCQGCDGCWSFSEGFSVEELSDLV